ncbi:MAG: FAD-binding oxidoreductase [Candidatus Pacearchaeota archaeon]
MAQKVKLLAKRFVTHDTSQFIFEKPEDFDLEPGLAAEISVNKEGWEEEKRPFTFTSLEEDGVLEFTIKEYPDHDGVTQKLHSLNPGEEILIHDTFQTFPYKGEGVFIAGGAGVTPFVAILRDLAKKGELGNNCLVFANKEHRDIILERELKEILGENCVFTLSREEVSGYENGHVDKEFLENKVGNLDDKKFYICGPPKMVDSLKEEVSQIKDNSEDIVFE